MTKKKPDCCYKILIQYILINYDLSPSKYSPSNSIHFCIRSCHPRKHLVKSSSLSLFSSLVTEALISSRNEKWVPFIIAFAPRKSQKSQGAISGEQGGWLDQHDFDFWFWHARLLGSEWFCSLPLPALPLCFRIVLKNQSFISCDNLP